MLLDVDKHMVGIVQSVREAKKLSFEDPLDEDEAVSYWTWSIMEVDHWFTDFEISCALVLGITTAVGTWDNGSGGMEPGVLIRRYNHNMGGEETFPVNQLRERCPHLTVLPIYNGSNHYSAARKIPHTAADPVKGRAEAGAGSGVAVAAGAAASSEGVTATAGAAVGAALGMALGEMAGLSTAVHAAVGFTSPLTRLLASDLAAVRGQKTGGYGGAPGGPGVGGAAAAGASAGLASFAPQAAAAAAAAAHCHGPGVRPRKSRWVCQMFLVAVRAPRRC